MFQEILAAIKAFDRIIIHRHGRPDGDAMGSQIGMKHIILENFHCIYTFIFINGNLFTKLFMIFINLHYPWLCGYNSVC